jgi:hypothetical protein
MKYDTKPVVPTFLFCLLIAGVYSTSAFAQEAVHWDVVAKIREEGFQRSQVMDVVGYMTDVLGPRVTGSRRMKKAQQWAKSKMEEMGLENTVIEPFGAHGVSWDNEYVSLHMIEPDYQPLIGFPYAFTPGTSGTVRHNATIAVIRTREDFDKYRGKLRDTIVLSSPPRSLEPRFEPDAARLTAERLAHMEQATIASRYGIGQRDYEWNERQMSFAPPRDPEARSPLAPSPEELDQFVEEVPRYYKAEGVVAVLDPAAGRDGTVFVGGRPGSRYDRSYEGVVNALPRVALAAEHYNRIFRVLKRGIPVILELDVRNSLDQSDPVAHNVIGELPGTDLADQIVMVGGHFDSWHAGTGATDDAAGCAIALEAVRILKAIGAHPRRTIRVAFWSWEEGGKVGSRRYVEKHFGSPETDTTAAHENLSVYFNVDNGSGRFRGIYLQGNEHVRRIFTAWMQPFRDLEMNTLTSNNTFGVDIVGFDMAGLPAFQFIQDPLDYGTRTHHSNMDVYDRLVAEDMRKNAVILASFLYHAAMRDEVLPRESH